MPKSLRADYHYTRRAKDIMESPANISPEYPLDKFIREHRDEDSIRYFVVGNDQCVRGTISNYTALRSLNLSHDRLTAGDIASRNYITVDETTTVFDLLTRMRAKQAALALVTDGSTPTSIKDVKGLISQEVIARSTEDALELFADESP